MHAKNTSLTASPVTPLDRSGTEAAGPPRKLDLSGPVLGARYRLLHLLGRRGAVAVHAGEDLDSGRKLAIRLHREPQHGGGAPRYFIETRAAINLCHPNIAEIVDFGRDILDDGEPVAYVVMEQLEGESLADTLVVEDPLPWTLVLTIAKQICLGLIEAHEQCIVHCNIGPSTCFRVLRGAEEQIKLLDFGDAAFACKRTGQCTPDPRPGAPGSAAPELLAGEAFDRRVDIYALGHLMYRLATHELPYGVGQDRTEPIPMCEASPSASLPAAFEAVVRKALASDRTRRYDDARAMHEAIVEAERAPRGRSRLATDPLVWDRDTRRAASWNPPVPAASDSSLAWAEFADPDEDAPQQSASASVSFTWAPAPTWWALFMRASLAMMLTTVAVRTAWTLLS